jgi:GT2 family glycosyltransferase
MDCSLLRIWTRLAQASEPLEHIEFQGGIMADSLWVLIAAAGKPTLLKRTLDSLAAAQKPPSYRGTLVVENGPRCGIESIVRGYSGEHRFQHLYVAEANKSHALNCGLAQLVDALVFMTDDDVRLDAQVLMAYDSAANENERGVFYGGPVRIDAAYGLPPEWMRRFYPQTIAEPWSLPYHAPTPVRDKTFMGTNWAAFASDLLAAGGFDSRLGPGPATVAAGQETEAQRRLVANGSQAVYVPGAIAWHYLHPEFLTPEWVLRRAYRHALEWGIRRTRGRRSVAQTIARAAIGRLNAHLKGVVLRLLGDEELRFEADFHEAKWRGRWNGLWLGRKWDTLPQLKPPVTTARLAKAA